MFKRSKVFFFLPSNCDHNVLIPVCKYFKQATHFFYTSNKKHGSKNKFVRITMGLLICNFLFNIFSILRMLLPLNCTIVLQLISLHLARFCNFQDVVADEWTPRGIDGQTNRWMDQWMDNVSFLNRCDRRIWKWWFSNKFCNFYDTVTDRRTHQWTDGPMDGQQAG